MLLISKAARVLANHRSKMPAPLLSTSACMNIASCAVIWSVAHTRKCFYGRSIP